MVPHPNMPFALHALPMREEEDGDDAKRGFDKT